VFGNSFFRKGPVLSSPTNPKEEGGRTEGENMGFLKCFGFLATLFCPHQSNEPVDYGPVDPGPFFIQDVVNDFENHKPFEEQAEEKLMEWYEKKMRYLGYQKKENQKRMIAAHDKKEVDYFW